MTCIIQNAHAKDAYLTSIHLGYMNPASENAILLHKVHLRNTYVYFHFSNNNISLPLQWTATEPFASSTILMNFKTIAFDGVLPSTKNRSSCLKPAWMNLDAS